MTRHSRYARTAAAITLAAAALSLSACSVLAPPAPARAVPADHTTPSPAPVVVAIGDSIVHGKGVQPTQAWPDVLAGRRGWRMTDLGINGAGFLAHGWRGGTFRTEIDQVARLQPKLILISGSRNDLHQPDSGLDAAIPAEFERLRAAAPHAVIVAISAIWNEQAAPAKLGAITERVRVGAERVRGVFLSIGEPLAGKRYLLQADDVHPTAVGQQALADAIDDALTAARVRV